jgi:hypothetical protein
VSLFLSSGDCPGEDFASHDLKNLSAPRLLPLEAQIAVTLSLSATALLLRFLGPGIQRLNLLDLLYSLQTDNKPRQTQIESGGNRAICLISLTKQSLSQP